jgi:hypothetical protein
LCATGVLMLPSPPPIPPELATLMVTLLVFVAPVAAYLIVLRRARPAAPWIKVVLASVGLGLASCAGLVLWVGVLRFGF